MVFKQSFDSGKNSITQFEKFMLDIKHEFGLVDEIYYTIMVAVTEAFNNAVIHGNKCVESKKVRVEVQVKDKKFTISIQDEGQGFDPSKIADPRDGENLLKSGGRGVFLIENLSMTSSYEFLEHGTKVSMVFGI